MASTTKTEPSTMARYLKPLRFALSLWAVLLILLALYLLVGDISHRLLNP